MDLVQQWYKRKGSEPWSIDDIVELVTEASRGERERILSLLPKHMPKTQKELVAHEAECYWCANFYGLGIAWKILQKGDDEQPEWFCVW
jgi:hypothetical protein